MATASRAVIGALAAFALLGVCAVVPRAWAQDGTAPMRTAMVPVLTVSGPIGPALADYVERALDAAAASGVPALVLRLDTPGGLDGSMRRIVEAILGSPVAVIGYVAPRGARAASAGTYILLAAHVAAMAPATTLGAATPVRLDAPIGEPRGAPNGWPAERPDTPPTLEDKALSDATAYLRGLARLRGRNVAWAERAVTEAASLHASEALAEGVVDLVAEDVPALLVAVEGRTVSLRGAPHTIALAGAAPHAMEPDWRTELLAIVTHPTVAYLLLTIGLYGLILEFLTPGSIGPGVIGGICLLLALYGMRFLPVDYTGVALIGLGAALIVAEALAPSFGVLGIGGVLASIAGAVMLLDTDVPGLAVSRPLLALLGAGASGALLLVLAFVGRARRRPVVSGPEEMLASEGVVVDWHGDEGRVRVHGELWRARATAAPRRGERVRVIDRDGLVLVVDPMVTVADMPSGDAP